MSPVRTGIGKFMGALETMPAAQLATIIVRAVVERSGIDPARIDDVIFAQSYSNSEAPCIGRWAALAADFPVEVPGLQIDRRCGGGLQALATAAMMVQTGAADVVLAGGVESMSNVEYYTTSMRGGARSGSVQLHDRLDRGRERSQPVERFGAISGLIETAENLASRHGITREACDLLAAESHRRAGKAQAEGLFDREIVSIAVPRRGGQSSAFTVDEGIRTDTTIDRLAALKPLLRNGVTTAGNASQQNDAAAACLVVAEDRLAALDLEPMGYLLGWTAVGCDPATMGWGPVPAVARLFERLRIGWDDIGLVELNEAFAAQVLAVVKGWGWNDPSRLNVNGSGISLGHPIGATGVRMMVSLLHEMERRDARYGLETMCVGGGQGMAALFERR
ncbi:MAG: acetyl-CoA acetyltransferase [Bradyrhizobium sp.]|nr:acetyl-CoA acetyltransferase [Bradyrhizobium sp.]